MAKSKGNFETSLSTLERIVAQLESGDLPLERALELFEEGVGLAGQCQSQLQEAERKVEMLLRERGEIKVVPFGSTPDGHPAESENPKSLSGSTRAASSNEDKGDHPDDAIPF